MSTNSDTAKELAAHFRRMADAIEHNAEALFSGACVIVPPLGGGEAIEFLQLGKPDLGQFYGAIQTRIQVQLQDMQEKQRLSQGFGVR